MICQKNTAKCENSLVVEFTTPETSIRRSGGPKIVCRRLKISSVRCATNAHDQFQIGISFLLTKFGQLTVNSADQAAIVGNPSS